MCSIFNLEKNFFFRIFFHFIKEKIIKYTSKIFLTNSTIYKKYSGIKNKILRGWKKKFLLHIKYYKRGKIFKMATVIDFYCYVQWAREDNPPLYLTLPFIISPLFAILFQGAEKCLSEKGKKFSGFNPLFTVTIIQLWCVPKSSNVTFDWPISIGVSNHQPLSTLYLHSPKKKKNFS